MGDHRLADFFIVVYLVFALFWDAHESSVVRRLLRAHAASLVRIFGLDHAWNMYTGPFVTMSRLMTRVTFADGTVAILPPYRRYEFRRFYFMIGNRNLPALFTKYLRVIKERAGTSSQQVVSIELVKQVWKAPIRRGGFWGTFEVPELKDCRQTVVATWTRT